MDNKVIYTESVAEDCLELGNNLRADDVMECQAAGFTGMKALFNSFLHSKICFSAKVNGKTEAMFGLSTEGQPDGFGLIWFLGSDECFKHPISLVRDGRKVINTWLKDFKMLFNFVDERNTQHIAWLKHLGFTFSGYRYFNNYRFLLFFKILTILSNWLSPSPSIITSKNSQ